MRFLVTMSEGSQLSVTTDPGKPVPFFWSLLAPVLMSIFPTYMSKHNYKESSKTKQDLCFIFVPVFLVVRNNTGSKILKGGW